MKIDYSQYFEVKPDEPARSLYAVTITANGKLNINGKLMEKLKDEPLNILLSKDLKSIIISAHEGSMKLPKSGSLKITTIARKFAEHKIKLPVRYAIKWEKENELWMGILDQNVMPKSTRKKRNLKIEDVIV